MLNATISQAIAFMLECEDIWSRGTYDANELASAKRATPLEFIPHNNELDQDMGLWQFADGSSVLIGANGAEVRHVAN